MLVVGSDFTDVAAPTEFSVNAAVAANLGSRLLLVVAGPGRDPARWPPRPRWPSRPPGQAHAHVTGVVANQVARRGSTATRSRGDRAGRRVPV